MTSWQVGLVPINTDQGTRYIAPGWVNDKFGIDCRHDSFGDWAMVITHLKTGFVVATLAESLETAKFFAENVAELGDWDFNDPAECKPYGKGVKEALRGLTRANSSEYDFRRAGEPAA